MEYMYPMDFEEFLMATSSHGLIDEIYKCYNSSIPMTSTLHEKLMGLYRMYLCVRYATSSAKYSGCKSKYI